MSAQRLIEGVISEEIASDPVADRQAEESIVQLEQEVDELREALSTAHAETVQAKAEAALAVRELRRQLSPLYRALQVIFGEMDKVRMDNVDDSGGSGQAPSDRTTAIWSTWKQRLGGQCAKIIDALMLQPGMNTTQLGIAIGTHRNNIPALIYKLNKAGLIDKNGGRFSLKQL
jgi:hypothetical protein